MTRRLRRITPSSAGKTLAALYGSAGLLFLPLFYLMTRLAPQGTPGLGFGLGFALAMPILYAAVGFVMGYVGSLLYNWIASLTGGIEFVVEAPAGSAT
ncbi:MAG: hypothetical protein L0I24_21680 [Pseudonocardia sp.]|nr:hypothetical protein [Pseudonocardia sp.]